MSLDIKKYFNKILLMRKFIIIILLILFSQSKSYACSILKVDIGSSVDVASQNFDFFSSNPSGNHRARIAFEKWKFWKNCDISGTKQDMIIIFFADQTTDIKTCLSKNFMSIQRRIFLLEALIKLSSAIFKGVVFFKVWKHQKWIKNY